MNRRGKVVVAHVAVLAVLLVAFGAWWWWREGAAAGRAGDPGTDAASAQAGAPAEDAPERAAAVEQDDPSTTPGDGPGATDADGGEEGAVVLPALDESDGFVRAWLEVRAAQVWTAWRVREDLVRLAAVLLEYAARGQVPRRSLSFITVGRFEVREEGERIFIQPRSYARYDAVVETALALPAEDAAALFALLEPLLAAAVRELDASAPSPRALLERAVDHVLATPVLIDPVALSRQAVRYEFADPALEALAPLQKQLLRTGPANVGKAQQYARRLRAALTPR